MERLTIFIKGILLGVGLMFTFEIRTRDRESVGTVLLAITSLLSLLGL